MIDVEIVEADLTPAERTRAERTADRARSVADVLERVGLSDLAGHARHAATTIDRAQAVADAARPALSAIGSLADALEESGILRHTPRHALGRNRT